QAAQALADLVVGDDAIVDAPQVLVPGAAGTGALHAHVARVVEHGEGVGGAVLGEPLHGVADVAGGGLPVDELQHVVVGPSVAAAPPLGLRMGVGSPAASAALGDSGGGAGPVAAGSGTVVGSAAATCAPSLTNLWVTLPWLVQATAPAISTAHAIETARRIIGD